MAKQFSDADFRISSFTASGTSCVAVAMGDGKIAVRHSMDPDGPLLVFSEQEWEAFLNGVKAGEFELP